MLPKPDKPIVSSYVIGKGYAFTMKGYTKRLLALLLCLVLACSMGLSAAAQPLDDARDAAIDAIMADAAWPIWSGRVSVFTLESSLQNETVRAYVDQVEALVDKENYLFDTAEEYASYYASIDLENRWQAARLAAGMGTAATNARDSYAEQHLGDEAVDPTGSLNKCVYAYTNGAFLYTSDSYIAYRDAVDALDQVKNGGEKSPGVYYTDKDCADALAAFQAACDNLVVSQTSAAPESIVLTPGSDESSMNLTWYMIFSSNAHVLYAPVEDLVDGQMPEHASRAEATTSAAAKENYYYVHATMTGLQPDTEYAYVMVNNSVQSEVHTFKTAAEGEFSFLFAGDPQIGASGDSADDLNRDAESWGNTLSTMLEAFPDSAFLITPGDQVESGGREEQYDAYLNHPEFTTLPNAPVAGNHDAWSATFQQHFNFPNHTTYGDTWSGGDYWFTYNDVLFLMLNDNKDHNAGETEVPVEEHKAFMEQAIAANEDASWKVVVMHHSVYSSGTHASDEDVLELREKMVPVFEELGIDVVLAGHDHTYTRSYLMDGHTPLTEEDDYDNEAQTVSTNPDGILYMTANSSSGSKYYGLVLEQPAYAAVMNQENVPNFSRVTVSDEAFTITTYRATDLTVVDTFTIRHAKESTLTIQTRLDGEVVDTQTLPSQASGTNVSVQPHGVVAGETEEEKIVFQGWSVGSGAGSFVDSSTEAATFLMGDEDTVLYADYETVAIPVVDKTDLEDQINQARAVLQEDYTAESYQALQDALAQAQAVMENEDATQEAVAAACLALEQAMKSLVPVEEPSPETPAEEEPSDEEQTPSTEFPHTGAAGYLVSFGALALVSVAVIVSIRKRK